MEVLLVLWCLLLSAGGLLAGPATMQVPKCCPEGQQIAADLNGCAPLNGSSSEDGGSSLPGWLSGGLWVLRQSDRLWVPAHLVRWSAKVAQRARCPWSRALLVPQSWGDDPALFVVAEARGCLISPTRANALRGVCLGPHSYCLDAVQCDAGQQECAMSHAAALCPCDSAEDDCAATVDCLAGQSDFVNDTHRWALDGSLQCPGSQRRDTSLAVSIPQKGESCPNVSTLLLCGSRFHYDIGANEVTNENVFFSLMAALGMVFLVATIAVYSVLPGLLHRLHARTVLAHASCLVVAYAGLIATNLQLELPYRLSTCIVIGQLMNFPYMASFFWLNVMCINISLGFSGIRSVLHASAHSERRRFWWFSLYAWGAAALICSVGAAVGVTRLKAQIEQSPFIPADSCIMDQSKYPSWFFDLPIALILLGNLALFAYTSWRIAYMRRGTEILEKPESQSSEEEKKFAKRYKAQIEIFKQYAKLSGVMGLTWIIDISIWFSGMPVVVQYLVDLLNLLRAFFLFYILCCKPDVLRLLRTRFPRLSRRLGAASVSVQKSLRLRPASRPAEPSPDELQSNSLSSSSGSVATTVSQVPDNPAT